MKKSPLKLINKVLGKTSPLNDMAGGLTHAEMHEKSPENLEGHLKNREAHQRGVSRNLSPLNDMTENENEFSQDQKDIISSYRATESDPTLPKWEHDISDRQILQIDSLKTGKGKYGDMSFKETYPLQKDIMRKVWYKSMDPNKGTKIPSWINK